VSLQKVPVPSWPGQALHNPQGCKISCSLEGCALLLRRAILGSVSSPNHCIRAGAQHGGDLSRTSRSPLRSPNTSGRPGYPSPLPFMHLVLLAAFLDSRFPRSSVKRRSTSLYPMFSCCSSILIILCVKVIACLWPARNHSTAARKQRQC